MNKQLLIVTHDYPPINSARAIRWSALAEYWAQQGHNVDIISAWQTGFAKEEELNGVGVQRVNAMWLENLRGQLKREKSLRNEKNPTQPGERERPQLRRVLSQIPSWVYQRIYKQLYWPDSAFPWYLPASNLAKTMISSNPPDALITVSPYFTAHCVGYNIQKAFPHLFWLVDIGDPFSFLEVEPANNHKLYRALNHRTEGKILRNANAICVTTLETLNKYIDCFPDCATKIHVVPPLCSFSNLESALPPFFPPDTALRLVYLGRLYKDVRSPDFILRLFTKLLEKTTSIPLELHFVGDTREVSSSFEPYRQLMGKALFLHDPVDPDGVKCIMRDADILVNIGNKTSFQLPSKVVEYATSGKPILNLAQIENDSSSAFFQNYPAALNLLVGTDLDFEQQVNAFAQFTSNLPPQIDQNTLEEWLSAYQIEAISDGYERLITESSNG
jgi:hypothetical protein